MYFVQCSTRFECTTLPLGNNKAFMIWTKAKEARTLYEADSIFINIVVMGFHCSKSAKTNEGAVKYDLARTNICSTK